MTTNVDILLIVYSYVILQIEVMLGNAKDSGDSYRMILQKVSSEKPSEFVKMATLEQHGFKV